MNHPRDQRVLASFALIVTTDTRTEEDDFTGKAAISLLKDNEQKIAKYLLIPNNSEKIRNEVEKILSDKSINVIITSGGTGIGSKDLTVDTLMPLFQKHLPGFGEHFRRLSFEEIGGSAIMSRATGGIIQGKLIFCLPGSINAVTLALSKIIIPNLGHMLWEINRK
ncbi:MogA/MoaB family molybdenum cofactor biosynthesis protein [Candidatus Bathyarchaeota archaeon]|nr:MogA/MoaB family molybdenum cofactor biosynthesis protein [Candidatus Bathyarchaeota archaeon]